MSRMGTHFFIGVVAKKTYFILYSVAESGYALTFYAERWGGRERNTSFPFAQCHFKNETIDHNGG